MNEDKYSKRFCERVKPWKLIGRIEHMNIDGTRGSTEGLYKFDGLDIANIIYNEVFDLRVKFLISECPDVYMIHRP